MRKHIVITDIALWETMRIKAIKSKLPLGRLVEKILRDWLKGG